MFGDHILQSIAVTIFLFPHVAKKQVGGTDAADGDCETSCAHYRRFTTVVEIRPYALCTLAMQEVLSHHLFGTGYTASLLHGIAFDGGGG